MPIADLSGVRRLPRYELNGDDKIVDTADECEPLSQDEVRWLLNRQNDRIAEMEVETAGLRETMLSVAASLDSIVAQISGEDGDG